MWLIVCLLLIGIVIVVKVSDRKTVKNISWLLLALLITILVFGVFLCHRA